MFKRKIYNFLISLLSVLPYHSHSYICKFCTYFLKSVVKYRSKVIFSNLQCAFPSKTDTEIKNLADKNYLYLVTYLLQTLAIYNKKDVQKDIKFSNPHVLNAEIEKGRTIMLLGSHFGNWEWSSMLLPKYAKSEVYAIYKPLANKTLDGLVKKWRGNFGLKLLAMNDVVKHLSTNKSPAIYIFVSDQSPQANSGKWFLFLNQETAFYEGTEILSKRYNATVFYQKINVVNDKYEVSYSLLEDDITKNYVEMLEKDIIENPAPWLWSHNRWKHKKNVQS